ncbi:hypothetical protein CPAST_c12790 [Clostridium pasteurianum DSM 525 = ATCC 6013]|uniref:Flagellar hook-length control protein FliK n=1 Tax=Clostridium pasteurianum DSM 525 = ATCC 6013 TaxID=1262449 RepID=A0A0H3J1T9_CLOPA|nr:hypothetical protein [Clostridium pasteurianum]AJA47379.1 hypothetical protein CPAST_c12790 [Clostridium pasteurianum DSM 525 = ATCC 6013]AJA51367.1 hypothetical protein CLPA_c12790 [Clostridium pasteurianum DSM 525 = ATCC 6013]AOZ74709.1 hypothetical protein AQ983_06170 [Clostridium pasteurianum DSM 525 = ATCC 6013]AOZ78505.1 hypothetical protein AQ984_06160 [Clostridium pasteurianum]ELP58715.1 hypothetical protein F502_13068 [Clostridium pasteurianum DSM 525 = ATCC 6013]
MAGISNINNPMQYGTGKLVRKLSFEIGEIFSARIVDENVGKNEVVLKLTNGWKFSAKLVSSINYNTNVLNKFIVDGYEDGKIKIKMFSSDKGNSENVINSQEGILKNYINNTYTKEDYNILKSLMDHNIPLTKENILNVKSLMKFKDSIIENPDKADEFILHYMKNNNIDVNSVRGKEVKKLLEKLFTQLKNISQEEIAFFMENGIGVDGDNIESFNKIFKQNSEVYKLLENIKEEIYNPNIFDDSTNSLKRQAGENILTKSLNSSVDHKEIDNKLSENNLNKVIISEINSKIDEMKNIIRNMISSDNLNKESLDKILSTLGKSINDIKVFNDISQAYYYLDIPLNFKNSEYNFKLILKDDRKSGKKVDSKDVKFIASVKTVNMGTIDAFITVNNKNLNIDIKSEEKWTRILEVSKNRLLNKIEQMGYAVNVYVKPKENEVNILNSRSFFNNEYIYNLDKRV